MLGGVGNNQQKRKKKKCTRARDTSASRAPFVMLVVRGGVGGDVSRLRRVVLDIGAILFNC